MKYFTYNIYSELEFRTSRSGGKGGQHVNKTESKVEVVFNILNSLILDNDTKQKLIQKLGKRIESGVISLYVQQSRSQVENKELAIKKLYDILDKALIPVIKRKKTKISKAAKEKRIGDKKKHSEIKEGRKKVR